MKKRDAKRKGMLYIVSAPSGAGKTTLCRQLIRTVSGLKPSISYTTRPPRRGEKNNVHYSFISERRFKNMIQRGEFAEWAVVHGNLYGTSIKRLEKMSKAGYDIILDIDTHGAMQLKKRYKDSIGIFILPPSMGALKERLGKRKSESDDEIKRRLKRAKGEIAEYKNYDYIVINDDLKRALKELESIIISTRLATERFENSIIERLLRA
jgi:guanylate kinase